MKDFGLPIRAADGYRRRPAYMGLHGSRELEDS